MRSRKEILNDLAHLNGNLNELENELLQYPWDISEPLLIFRKVDFYNLLNKFLNDEIDLDKLYIWTNLVECRDDFIFEEERIKEIVFDLANAVINEEITKDLLIKIIEEIK